MNTKKNFKQIVTSINYSEGEYIDILNNIKGDADGGFDFSKVVEYSLAYLINNNFTNLTDKEYTLETFKAILDKANLKFKFGYKPNLVLPYNGTAEVTHTPLLITAYLIIQFDYYFKTINLKETDFYKYTVHYFSTNKKLNIDLYKGDKNYLLKEYGKMDKEGMHRAKYHIKKAFIGSLFLLVNELQLPTIHFRYRTSDCREYNAMVKTPREFRKYFPFELKEHDIKSAFPRFIDEIIGSNISADVYELIMECYNLDRPNAKVLFNTWLNSSKYKTKEQFYTFFKPIYKEKTPQLVELLTNKEKPFWQIMFYWEMVAIETFVEANKIEKYTRLHDAVFVIENEYNTPIKHYDFSFVSFGQKCFIYEKTIQIATNVKNAKSYLGCIPYELRTRLTYEVNLTEGIASKRIKDFRFYKNEFYFLNANFNISANGFIKDGEFCFYDVNHFKDKLQNMANVIAHNNNLSIVGLQTYLRCILTHILENGVLSFDVEQLLYNLILEIEEPQHKLKNHTYNGRNTIDLFEYQKLYFQGLKIFDSICFAESVFKTIKTSYKEKTKCFIDFKGLGISCKKQNLFIVNLIHDFNTANGINDVRTARSFTKILEKKRELGHTIQNDIHSVSRNALFPCYDSELQKNGIRPQTIKHYNAWLQIEPDYKKIQDVYFDFKHFIDNADTMFEVVKENGRNQLKENNQTTTENFIPFAEAWNEFSQSLMPENEFNKTLEQSILNIDEVEAIQQGAQFYKEWKVFNNKTKYTPHHHEHPPPERNTHHLIRWKEGA